MQKVSFQNEMRLVFDSLSQNEAFARTCVACFAVQLNPTIAELADVKTAVSEAVTNAIIHGYAGSRGPVTIHCGLGEEDLYVEVNDRGVGIEDIRQAMEPMYTTRPEMERSGMGFAFMEAFMDELEVSSQKGQGTTVRMRKHFIRREQ